MVYKKWNKENLEKAERKIQETEDFFYNISQQYDERLNTTFHTQIFEEVQKLNQYITDNKIETARGRVKQNADIT